ncbi:FAD-dependent oxidoreductase [Streptomyces sp. A7024]|uniref:FAD-dependent oxidoreductase n=1 Tax=Streptomyces coryli TaxID=1128680 RepID=A0A6G4TZI2_9ACTN|nr:FAD-dependent oxidoreductase [Streptomyces coryli]NGN65304.1 FAD-dependent oxidoreductase [Streptomyces coryli]
MEDTRLAATADVVVVGSGSAGASAAIAAARTGASVVLIERNAFLGGTSTAVLDTFYGFYTPGSRPLKVVGGIGDEVVEALTGLGPVIRRPNSFGAGTGVTYHPEHLKVAWEQLVLDAGVRVLLHTTLQGVRVGSDDAVQNLIVATKAGPARVEGRVFVDASGDADLCHFAGFGYELAGEREPAQTLTTTFRMANVDLDRRRPLPKRELAALMREAAASGAYDLPRLEGSDHITPVDHVTATIMTRLPSYRTENGRTVNATDPDLLTAAEMAGRRQALEYVRFLRDRVPGYAHAQLIAFGSQIGVRETRRVYGDYRLTREDVLGVRQFPDQIALCGAPIEDHNDGVGTGWTYLPDGQVVGVPLRTLVVRDAANVLVAGRCFSATHDAHASVRSMAQCMALGQAAGTAAAMAATGSGSTRDVDPESLRRRLRAAGAVVTGDDVREAEPEPSLVKG